jgi:hypothetical protein
MEFAGIEVIHSQPGEINLAIARLQGDQNFAKEFKSRFSAIHGIYQVEPDAARGEVLVLYDKQALTSLSSLLALKATFSHLFPEVDTFRLATWLSKYL